MKATPRRPVATTLAPQAIGTYSQAVVSGNLVFLSGQIPLAPSSMQLVAGGFDDQIRQVLDNLEQVCIAAGGGLNDLVKVTIYLTDLSNFELVNQAMAARFGTPYPARAVIGVASLPRGASIEMDGILVLPDPTA